MSELKKIASNLLMVSEALEANGFKRIAKLIEKSGEAIMEEADINVDNKPWKSKMKKSF